jgi:uncharacterized protein YcnI
MSLKVGSDSLARPGAKAPQLHRPTPRLEGGRFLSRHGGHDGPDSSRRRIETARKTLVELSNTVLLGALAIAFPAQAHIVLEQRSAPAASYYKAVFMVGHGCEGSPTTSISVEIPDGVVNIKPMPKPGWEVRTRVEKLARPYELHGKTFTEGVTRVTWTGGPLLDAHFDEFVMMTRLPDAPGTAWFKVVQTCEQGETRWEEIPAEGKATHDYRTPAAALDILPVEGHKHH